ncbi:CYTH and CHAD domain-containing protein [Amycolatopsis alkalitolerans]|uniref:CYTH and CHAD domain-containing protein n=1 Tax=Amycolatopsis alkalitolerans TaxID=2547244 RepID=A0A5C4LRH8_9PSEU|nr:CYTH and CHAD domain-containing protein [Amycolatopsis alkalitolerans]TNC21309.1 CYTH and CHAD domain-containing protein [Amycolatopsis alkalitolerans]
MPIDLVAEVERKYELPPGRELPALSGLPGVTTETSPETFTLDATYYDTADLRLLRGGLTLRRRTGGDDAGWHLKIPAGTDARTEVRLPLAETLAVPHDLASLVRSYARAMPLEPQATIHTERTRRRLLDEHGVMRAEVVLDRVRATGPGGRTHEWAEVEVEQAADGRPLADAIESRLRAAGITRSSSPAKLVRVLGTVTDRRPAPNRRSTAGEVVGAYLRAQSAALAAGDLAVRRGEADSVHQMRVAARRARSTLQVYAKLFDPTTRPLADELGWLGVQLSAARDAEVQRDRLLSGLAELADERLIAHVRRHFDERAERARGLAIAALDSERYLELLGALEAVEPNAKAERRAAKAIPKTLAAAVAEVDERLRASHAAHGRERDERVHRVRKAAKRLRYAIEVARPISPLAARDALAEFTGLQDLLGEHQDAVVAQAELRTLAEDAPDSFALGVLYQRERDIADARIARLDGRWRKARRAVRTAFW